MTSRLSQMQAQFQQKQMQEKEEKLLKLYESQQQRAFERVGRGSAGSNTNTTSIRSTGGGKVRQMFDERRQKAGIDKSYPLEPLKPKTSVRGPNLEGKTATSRTTVVKAASKKSVSQVQNIRQSVSENRAYRQKVCDNNNRNESYEEQRQVLKSYDDVDNYNHLNEIMNNHSIHDDLDNEKLPEIGFSDDYQEKPTYIMGKLANVGGKLPSQKLGLKTEADVPIPTNGVTKNNSKVATKKPVEKTPTPPRSNSAVSSASSQSSRNSPARTENNMSARQTPQSQRAPSNNRPSSKQHAKSPVVRDDLAECRFCGRRFATDRLGVHEDICGKTGKKKRKTYDATKHRVQGTELEGYVMKGGKKGGVSGKRNKVAAVTSRNTSEMKSQKVGPVKSNWRKAHEEFIAAIRAAKEAQAYVAKGGKLADLPPPPPSSNPDYVQCPHCGRRFNEAAAQRHIPKCASYDFNKPKKPLRK